MVLSTNNKFCTNQMTSILLKKNLLSCINKVLFPEKLSSCSCYYKYRGFEECYHNPLCFISIGVSGFFFIIIGGITDKFVYDATVLDILLCSFSLCVYRLL